MDGFSEVQSASGEIQSDYEFEVSYDQFDSRHAVGRQTPLWDGEGLVGTFTVDKKHFGVQGGEHPQPTKAWQQTGTITIHRADGRTGTTNFKLTYGGDNGAVGISSSPVNWTRPSK